MGCDEEMIASCRGATSGQSPSKYLEFRLWVLRLRLKYLSIFGIRVSDGRRGLWAFQRLRSHQMTRAALEATLFSDHDHSRLHMGGCQNCGPFLGTSHNTAPSIWGTQKGTIVLTPTHISDILVDPRVFRARQVKLLNRSSVNLPKREELSFRRVLAFPKAFSVFQPPRHKKLELLL